MELENKLMELGLSPESAEVYGALVDLSKGDKNKAVEEMINFFKTLEEKSGKEFAKEYMELQAKRIDAMMNGDSKSHLESLEGLKSVLEKELNK